MTPWTVCSPLVPVSMEFSRQEYWSELLCPPPGNLPNPKTELGFPSRIFCFHCILFTAFDSLEVLYPNGEILLQGHNDDSNELVMRENYLMSL